MLSHQQLPLKVNNNSGSMCQLQSTLTQKKQTLKAQKTQKKCRQEQNSSIYIYIYFLRVFSPPKKNPERPVDQTSPRPGLQDDSCFQDSRKPPRGKVWWSICFSHLFPPLKLVGGFNPSEKYESKWVQLPQTGMNIKHV